MIENSFFYMDGDVVDEDIIKRFDLREHSRNLRYSSVRKSDVISFVGFIIKNNEMLVSMPKHYIEHSKIKSLSESDLKILFDIFMKTTLSKDQTYLGELEEFEANFPFKSFFDIYRYYQKYGLYKKTYEVVKEGYSGRISWKDTIRKSNQIVNGKSIIFNPLYIKKNVNDHVFITECMIYAINSTLHRFSAFIKLAPVNTTVNPELFANREYVIARLHYFLQNTFKDLDKKLINSLISFFENECDGGDTICKHYDFENIWERMIERYLNNYFEGIAADSFPVFKEKKNKQPLEFKKGHFKINAAKLDQSIQPDHYYVDEFHNQYIFDSKYYAKSSNKDYKQIAYTAILKDFTVGNIYSILFLPTEYEQKSETNFKLKEEYYNVNDPKSSLKTVYTYLNIKDVMLKFLK